MTTQQLSHKKMKNVDSKKCQSGVKLKNKIKDHQMNNLLVNFIETFLIYMYLI
jgi:hypothetical protein